MPTKTTTFETPWGPGQVRFHQGQIVEVTLPRGGGQSSADGESDEPSLPGKEAGPLSSQEGDWIVALEAAARGEEPVWPPGFQPELVVPPGFRREVYRTLLTVPRGDTIAYGSLACEAGFPGAARAVGTAMAANPLPLVIPCHRVVRSDGRPGRYGPNDSYKVDLLQAERAL